MSESSVFTLLPAIDLRGGRVVRLSQGDFEQETAYSDDPVAVARAFADEGAQWLHVVDLDAARTGTPTSRPVIAEIVAAVGGRVQVEVAGGLRDTGSVAEALSTGAGRVVIGTAALADAAFAERLVSTHGPERIAAAIDVRAGLAVGHGWAGDAMGVEASEAIGRLSDAGVVTFEVTAIERDGLLGGPDVSLYERLVQLGRGAIIASGGIASIDDLRAVRAIGCSGAIVGRAIYEGRLSVRDALAVGREPNLGPGPSR